MLEVAHRQNGSASFQPTKSASSSSPSRPASDLAPLPIRHLAAPPSPLVNTFTTAPFAEQATDEDLSDDQGLILANTTGPVHIGTNGLASSSKASGVHANMSASGSQAPPTLVRRIRKGQKWEDFQPPPCNELPSIQAIDSPFQLQEYLTLLIRQDPHNVEQIVALPQPSSGSPRSFTDLGLDKGKAKDDENTPFGSMDEEIQPVDEDVWIYEQLRRLVLDFSTPWLTMLQSDCDRRKNPKTCEAMNADDWMYLCASHGEEKQCCAIDYIIHTLDGTTALLNSQRHFPSRTFIPTTSLRHFGSVSRRLSRIFIHAFEHHRDVFEACEAETSLYARFLALVQTYDLISVDALPRLDSVGRGKGVTKSESIAKGHEEAISKLATVADLAEGKLSRRSSDKRQLFEAGAEVSSKEEDDEDEAGIDDIDADQKDEEVEQIKTRGRSDSAASRVTTIHVGPIGEDGAPLEAETKVEVNSQREKPGQEEVPQDVKDDDEEE